MVCKTVALALVLFFLTLQVCAVDLNQKVARRILKSVRRDLGTAAPVNRTNLGITNETFADDLSVFEDERRNLGSYWGCPNIWTRGAYFGHGGVSIEQPKTSHDPICVRHRKQKFTLSTWSGEPKGIQIQVRIKLVDSDKSCPGCYEQLHVGILDSSNKMYNNKQKNKDQHQCVNPGNGNFGTKKLTFTFDLEAGKLYNVFMYGGWDWKCQNDKKGVKHHLSHHADGETIARIFVW